MRKKLLVLKDIFYQTNGRVILKQINFSLLKGEIHSIIGLNGAGKTSLANLIMGLEGYSPTRGKIIFENRDITKLSLYQRAKLGIALAWQRPANFEGISVEEYLSLKKSKVSPADCLKKVGLNPSLYLKRIINEELSGGERKRIELASLIPLEPKLVILDEPDSGIDANSLEIIYLLIKDFKRKGISVLLITHNQKTTFISDRVSLLCNGEIIKQGQPGEIGLFFKKYCQTCNHIGKINKKILRQ